MADTFYMWTNLSVPDTDDPTNPRKATNFKPGDKVDAATLGLSDDEFAQLVESGAVRTYEYPDMGNFSGSPVELAKAKLAAAAEGGFFDTQYGTIGTDTPPDVDPETAKPIPAGTNAPGVTPAPAPLTPATGGTT